MSAQLASWLETHRQPILRAWTRALRSDSRSGQAPRIDRTALAALYDQLVTRAHGRESPSVPIESVLSQLEGAPASLATWLRVPFGLRRAAWEVALHQEPAAALPLLAALEPLIDQVVEAWARRYEATMTATLRQRVEEAEFMTTQLAVASEEADEVALRISRLYAFSRAISGSLQLHDLLRIIGEEFQQTLSADCCTIWLRTENDLINAHTRGYPEPLATQRYALHEASLVPQALQRSEPWLLDAPFALQDGGWVDPGAALLALPLIAGDKRLGVIVMQRRQQSFAAEQAVLAQSLASQAALALENACLYDQIVQLNAELEQRIEARTAELRTERDRLELLFAVSSAVSSTLDVDQMLAELLAVLAQRLHIRYASAMLIDAETAQLERRAVLGDTAERALRAPLGAGIAGWVARHAAPLLIDDVTADPRWQASAGGETYAGCAAVLAVPLVASDETLGVLTVAHPEAGHFSHEHQRLLTVIANEVAVALHNAALYHYISDQATRLAAMVRAERAASSQSQAILQSIADGVLVCDCDGQVILANAASARVLDQPLEELFLQNLHDILRALQLNAPERAPLQAILEAPLDEQGQPRRFRASFRRGPRSLDLSIGPVITESGDLLGGVVILRDITREMESDRLKTEFIGTVSHELRTPMTVIKGYLQLLTLGSTGELTPMQRQLLDTIAGNAERMTSIINDLLDITKIESGSVEMEFKPLGVLEAIGLAVSGQEALIEQRGHRLTLDVPADLPAVRADGTRFHQILDHLLSNAIKYTHRNGAITIRARQAAYDDIPADQRAGLASRSHYVAIAIEDTGIGIAPEDQARIWERFYRVDSELKVEAGGTRLGLALVRPLTQLMGGRVWVESRLGAGSTFTLLLPVA